MSELFGQHHDEGGPAARANVGPQAAKFASRSGSRRAVAIAVGAVLLSVGGVGAAYGVSAAASHGAVPTANDLASREVTAGLTVHTRTLPVTASLSVPDGVAVHTNDFDARVGGLVSEANRVVAEKAEAERQAAEDAERAARAAHHRAKTADHVDSDGDGDHWGGCSGKHHDAPGPSEPPVVTP